MKYLIILAFSILFLPVESLSSDTPIIITIDSTTATEALLARPGTYLGEKFTFEEQHSGETLVRVGVWEAGSGRITITDFPFTEYVLMISGVVIVTNQNGGSQKFSAGDTFVIPQGWSGTWDIKKRMKKQIVRIGDKKLMADQ